MNRSADLRVKILAFRNRELQSCLERLGLPKKGRKAELQSRLLAAFGQVLPGSAALNVQPLEQWRVERAGAWDGAEWWH